MIRSIYLLIKQITGLLGFGPKIEDLKILYSTQFFKFFLNGQI